ncbi:MAG: hypothetical protein FJ299_07575 [Planctomycetes bacterium]|nr:hypothetical protein [Planctomycetota bacterium]
MKFPTLQTAGLCAAAIAGLAPSARASDEDANVRPAFQLAPGGPAVCQLAVGSDVELSVVLYKECGAGEQLRFTVSDGRGVDWTTPLALPGASGAAKQVQRDSVHVIGARAFAVWSDDALGASSTGIRFARYQGGSWTLPLAVGNGLPVGVDVSAWKSISRSGPSGDVHVYVLATARGAATGGVDRVYLLTSNDAGASFLPAIAVTTAPSGADAEGLGLDVQGDRIVVAWTDDRNALPTPGSGLDLWVRAGTIAANGSVSWAGSEQQFDLQLGASTQSTSADPIVAIEGTKRGIAWLEDGLVNGNDQLYLRLSDDAGATWSAPELIGTYNPSQDSVAAFDFELVGPVWTLAWEDDRGGLTNVYRAESKDGAGFPETQLTTLGGRQPLISRSIGTPSGATVVYIVDTRSGSEPAAYYADQESGAEWHDEPLQLADGLALGIDEVVSPAVAYNHRYYNFVIPFLAGAGEPIASEPFITGFRPPSLYPEGFVAGPANPFFELGHLPFEDLFAFVLIAEQPGVGQLMLPDGRETGLAFDTLTTFGLSQFNFFFASNDPVARGAMTPALTTNLPSGFQFWACGITIGADLNLRHVTDRVEVIIP